MKRLSLGTWAFVTGPYHDRPVPFEACLQHAKALGYDGIELGARSPHPTAQAYPTAESRAELRRQIAEAGLGISGLGASFQGQSPLQEDRGAYLDQFETNLQFCQDLGIRTMRVDTGAPPERVPELGERPAMARTISAWKACAQQAAAKGIRVVWEFEPCFAFNTPRQIVEVARAVDEPNFGVLFDTCHAHMVAAVGARQVGEPQTLAGGVLELLELLRGCIGAFHVIDSDGTLDQNGTSTHTPIGQGILDFPMLVPALLQSAAPADWWCVDLCLYPGAWEAAGDCKNTLQMYLTQYDR